MKIAHAVIVTPHQCGLYETTRELVVALRKRGIDSRMVDPKPIREYSEDRGAPCASMEWAQTADLVINHSGVDGTPIQTKPQILVCHGRPRYSFLTERGGGTPVMSYHYQQNEKDYLKAVVTFWPEHVAHHQSLFWDTPVHYVQAPVDLEEWCPGPSQYDFKGRGGEINVVCTDAWRPNDIDPYYVLAAFSNWVRHGVNAKLHLYAKPSDLRGYTAHLVRLKNHMGEFAGRVKGLKHVYRSADFVMTGHNIDTRSVREALACGCPVARVNPDLSFELNPSRELARAEAIERFDANRTAEQFEAIL